MPIEELLEIGADQAVEVIDGEIVVMVPQKWKSTRIALDLYDALSPYVQNGKLGRLATEAAYALEIDKRKGRVKGVLIPDLSFISRARYEQAMAMYGEEDFLRIAPDFAVEVVSPSDKYSVVNRKVELYLQYGTQLVWVIDPQQGNTRVITPDQPAGQIMGVDSTLSGEPVLPGWSIRLKELLSGDR